MNPSESPMNKTRSAWGDALADWENVGIGIEQALALLNMFAAVYLDVPADRFTDAARHSEVTDAFYGIVRCLTSVNVDNEAIHSRHWQIYKDAAKEGDRP